MSMSEKFIYFGAGCGIGLALGALLAPQSGQETRHSLGSKVDDLTHRVQERINASGIRQTASQTLHDVVQKGKDVASIGRQRLNESIEAGRQRFNESIEGEDFAQR